MRTSAVSRLTWGVFRAVLLLCATAWTLTAQTLEIGVARVDLEAYPTVRLRVCLSVDGVPLTGGAQPNFQLAGRDGPIEVTTQCPDTARGNDIALVLDNTASILSGAVFASLVAAAHAVIDSLRSGDRLALFTLQRGVVPLVDFTDDTARLHDAVRALRQGSGSSPMYDVLVAAMETLGNRPGVRTCIFFGDGIDNGSRWTVSDVVDRARAHDIRSYFIAFGNTPTTEGILDLLAFQSGGKYYRLFDPALIVAMFGDIISEVTSRCCTVAYRVTTCTDSLHTVQITAMVGGLTATAQLRMRVPFRPDTIQVSVETSDVVEPDGTARVNLRIAPRMSGVFRLSFRGLLRFDPQLLTLSPLTPITVGTLSEGGRVVLQTLRPGVVELSASHVLTASDTNVLVGIRLKGVRSDSSRRIPIVLDSLTLSAGCGNIVLVRHDTIDVCQCWRGVVARMPVVTSLHPTPYVDVPVFVGDSIDAAHVVLTSLLQYDPDVCRPERAFWSDGAREVDIPLEVSAPGRLLVGSNTSIPHDPAHAAFTVRFLVQRPKDVTSLPTMVQGVRVYATCCPATTASASSAMHLDGECERILQRDGAATLWQSIPNPVRSQARIPFELHDVASAPQHVRIELHNAQGVLVSVLVDALHTAGRHEVSFPVESLPAGTYFYTLMAIGTTQRRSLVVVR